MSVSFAFAAASSFAGEAMFLNLNSRLAALFGLCSKRHRDVREQKQQAINQIG